jgi:hypothetical protein
MQASLNEVSSARAPMKSVRTIKAEDISQQSSEASLKVHALRNECLNVQLCSEAPRKDTSFNLHPWKFMPCRVSPWNLHPESTMELRSASLKSTSASVIPLSLSQ